MAKFITRVELHDADDYETLHKEMEDQGFSKAIKGSKDLYQLPRGEYFLSDVLITDNDDVMTMAKKAAKKVCENYGIIVTKIDGLVKLHNLKPIESSDK